MQEKPHVVVVTRRGGFIDETYSAPDLLTATLIAYHVYNQNFDENDNEGYVVVEAKTNPEPVEFKDDEVVFKPNTRLLQINLDEQADEVNTRIIELLLGNVH